jgi:hypothetical protein
MVKVLHSSINMGLGALSSGRRMMVILNAATGPAPLSLTFQTLLGVGAWRLQSRAASPEAVPSPVFQT